MRLTFRSKLSVIAGTAAFAMVTLITISTLLGRRVEGELQAIHSRYIPRVELGPRLEAGFERLRRSFQDAVAAGDLDALERTSITRNTLLEELNAARDVVDPTEAAAFRKALEDYSAAAYLVSRQMLNGEKGESLVNAMTAMQEKQAATQTALKAVSAFDREELGKAFTAASEAQRTAGRVRVVVSLICLAVVLVFSLLLGRGVLGSLGELAAGLERFGRNDFSTPIQLIADDELGDVARQANHMAASLQALAVERDRTDWLKGGIAGLSQELRGELTSAEIANRATGFLASYLRIPAAALYGVQPDGTLTKLGHSAAGGARESFAPGEGLLGQAATQQEVRVVSDVPEGYLPIESGLGKGAPRALVLMPLVHNQRVTGVVELALFAAASTRETELLLAIRETLAIALEVARARAGMRELLAETQRQAQRLATQEEELRATNEELQAQQEELRQSNSELSERAKELKRQREDLEHKNRELDDSRRSLEQKATELTLVSTYKSQFLANMSHELRTPLNSMLILSNLLAENETKNLTDKQVEFAQTVHSAGKDLLALINQVLDLAKIESGKQDVHPEPISPDDIVQRVDRVFEPVARQKGLAFSVEMAPGAPATLTTDGARLDQILNNLVGNALKFTAKGQVSLVISRPAPGTRLTRSGLRLEQTVAIRVSDTGIGIAPEDQGRIFAPFEQVDGSTQRRFGGTGLGLAISRELASLLGGELQLESTLGKGSTFTLYLPEVWAESGEEPPPVGHEQQRVARPQRPSGTFMRRRIEDDRDNLVPGEEFLLVIEDDPAFARIVGEAIHELGLKFLAETDGLEGLQTALASTPRGIILDVKLPSVDGWSLMEALKAEEKTAHIPVHFISGLEGAERGLALGATGYLVKPTTRTELVKAIEALVPRREDRRCRLLLVEEDAQAAASLLQQLEGDPLEARSVRDTRAALAALEEGPYDCIVLDLDLKDLDGLPFLQALRERPDEQMPAVIVSTGRPLSREEAQRLEAYAEAVVLKQGASGERLLDEVRMFARRLQQGRDKSPARRAGLSSPVRLDGRKLLVVDDDVRTVYALSAMLRAKGAEVHTAETGAAALSALQAHPEVDLVLMDIMMPEMDGYEAMRRIRAIPRFATLPLIALTAKAMKGDFEKCLEVGATDYLPKPVDPARLFGVLLGHLRATPS